MATSTTVEKDARISDCGLYRWWLSRRWDHKLPMVVFIMLNPSTADASVDDATIRKCMGFAKLWGYGGIVVVNLFSFRATKPKDMRTAKDPVGYLTDTLLGVVVRDANVGKVVAAWGAHGTFKARDRKVRELLKDYPMECLLITKDGHPGHPLFIPYDTALQPYNLN